jgi:hypothetical protein
MMHYTSLGAVPAIAHRKNERRDALLARTGPAARAVLRHINKLPRDQRVPELNRVLADLDPGAPARMHRVSEFLRRQGLSVSDAVERALALTLADASIEHFKRVGRRHRSGMQSMGSLGDSTTTGLGQDAGTVVGGMIQGLTCTPALRDSIAAMVGREEGREAHDATVTGFDAARAMSMCPTTPEVPLPPPEEPSGPSLVVPVLIGVGALVFAGGVVWYTGRKR